MPYIRETQQHAYNTKRRAFIQNKHAPAYQRNMHAHEKQCVMHMKYNAHAYENNAPMHMKKHNMQTTQNTTTQHAYEKIRICI